MYKQFLRNKNKRPIGVLVAGLVDGKLKFGWSMQTDPQVYDNEYGTDVAKARMDTCSISFLNQGVPSKKFRLPHSARSQSDDFIKRIRKTVKKNET